MNKKLVFVFLAGSALGVAGAQLPTATVKAAISKAHKHIFQGVAAAGLQSTIESGLATQAMDHANSALSLTGADALDMSAGQCPITALNLKCSVNEAGAREWQWEYSTKDISGTWSVGEPQ